MVSKRRRIPVKLVTIARADRVADQTKILSGPDAAAAALITLVGNKDREHFVVFHLDSRNQIIAGEIVAVGILSSCLVHPREVFKGAILNSAAAIICGHNHPSGLVTPSAEDLALEARLRDAGTVLGIQLLDFLVASTTGYWSSRETGRLQD